MDEISKSLKNRLSQWAHPSIKAQVKWKQDPDKSVKLEEPIAGIEIGERGFEGELSRFGHGLQRSYMFALLQELNVIDDKNAPTLILCIEEPELYQHPPQARHLAETLIELSNDNTQVLVCSHSPLFIPKNSFSSVRIVKEEGEPCYSINKQMSYDQLSNYMTSIGGKAVAAKGIVAKLYPYLSPTINEMFFCRIPIFVEGIEDIAYIKTYFELTDGKNDFRKLGCHIINADKKSNIIEPLAVAKLLKIPAFLVFDLDTNEIKQDNINRHKKDNKKLLIIQGHSETSEWPDNDIVKNNLWGWKTNFGNRVQNELPNWETYYNSACSEFGNAGGLHKNPLVITRTLELAWEKNEKSQSLEALVKAITEFAKLN